MRAILFGGLSALALSAAPVAAADGDNIEAQAGDLRIIHLWTREPEMFLEAWAGPTPPNLPVSSQTNRNVPVQQFILYANCTSDADGNCHLAAKVEITAPDGSQYGDVMEFDALPLSRGVPRNNIGMAPNSIGLVIEDGEQLGIYRVELSVTDTIARVTAVSLVSLEVLEAGQETD